MRRINSKLPPCGDHRRIVALAPAEFLLATHARVELPEKIMGNDEERHASPHYAPASSSLPVAVYRMKWDRRIRIHHPPKIRPRRNKRKVRKYVVLGGTNTLGLTNKGQTASKEH